VTFRSIMQKDNGQVVALANTDASQGIYVAGLPPLPIAAPVSGAIAATALALLLAASGRRVLRR
jgi:hypothetical protein